MVKPEIYNPIYYHRLQRYDINEFTIIGERHSGTNWLENLVLCRLNLPITFRFGSKHFIETHNHREMSMANHTLFICICRNIYDWIGGFYRLPHHVDISLCNSLVDFISSQWNCNDIDYLIYKNNKYKNIFDLRSTKLFYYYFCLPLIVNNLLIIKYEDLMTNPENIIDYISIHFNLIKSNGKYSKVTLPKIKHPYKFSKIIIDKININTDWSMENYYRYYPNNRT